MHLPIISDEVYYDLVFDDSITFESAGPLAATLDVPVICVNSLSKLYMVPGWRMGWAIVYNNKHGYLDQVKAGLNRIPLPL